MNLKITKVFMGLKSLIVCTAAFAATSASAEYRYVGGDISLLPEYEQAGAQYKDHDGKPIAELLPWLHEQGMNAMRVRLFVNPEDYSGADKDANACQDLEYIVPLCKSIKENGFSLLLDFHYSDTWADPAKQWTPKAWENLTDEELYAKIYSYTKECLQTLNDAGATPDFIQPGNEISYGMLWGPVGTSSPQKTFMGSDANWQRLGKLLSQAIKACREECPEAKIVIHTERVAQTDVQANFYNRMKELGVDYDIIGLSYYPYFHGNMAVLKKALDSLTTRFPEKNIMMVETGYSYKWEVPGTDQKVDYPYSDAGQDQFAKELVSLLLSYDKVDGLFWWWMEYNAFGTSLSGWYNAPLFDSTTGRATSALTTICAFAKGNDSSAGLLPDGEGQNAARWYDINGRPVNNPKGPGIYVNGKRKVIIK